jgi:thioesterase domain-containing protein
LVPDAEVPLPDIVAALQRLPRRVYVLLMPPLKQMAQLRTVASLAELFCQAVRSTVLPGPLVLAGVGAGGVIAHEMAVQMQRAGHEVGLLLLLLLLLGPIRSNCRVQ